MKLPKSQRELLHRLKTRGPQSVKILSNQLDMTSMGIRQHLAELERRDLVRKTPQIRQNRGRPVHLWELTAQGHGRFPGTHAELNLELIDVLQDSLGEAGLNAIIRRYNERLSARYRRRLAAVANTVPARLQRLAELRSEEGFMAEVRLVPDGWLLIENHCPIYSVAARCRQFCDSELEILQQLLAPAATVDRADYLIAGARRCAYKITAAASL